MTILEKARLELRKGQCEMARQLAAEAHNGPYGVQAEAAAVLRSIDVEEHNQRVLAANRSFDAGMAAYRSKDTFQAMAIFRQVDPSLLAADKRAQLREVTAAQPADTAAAPRTEVVTAGTPALPPGAAQVMQAGMSVPENRGAMPAAPTTQGGDTLAQQVIALQKIEVQRQREEGLKALREAKDQFDRGEVDTAMETLQAYRARLKASKLDPADVAMLERPIEHREQTFKLLRAQKDMEAKVGGRKGRFESNKAKEVLAEERKQEQVKDLMKEYNSLLKEGKYKEAVVVAEKAHELDPDNPATEGARQIAKIQVAQWDATQLKERKEESFLRHMNEAEDPGPAVDVNNPVHIDPATLRTAQKRKSMDGVNLKTYTESERKIQAKLSTQIDVNFKNVPLRQAVDDLRVMTGVNIVPELRFLEEEGVSLDKPVTLKMDQASLKSVLRLMLDQVHLTYVIGDEALKITTERRARGQQVTKVYSVADLVIPVDDYAMPLNSNLQKAMDRTIEQQRINLGSGNQPFNNGRNMLPGGEAVGNGANATMSTAGGASMSTGMGNPGSTMNYTGTVTPQKQTMQDTLIKLVTDICSPYTWSSVGGPGTIEYMPVGMALVINQTPDVQEQVAELLDALRRLQDLEVAVEVRILTLAETFFERIGLDFNLNIKTDKNTRPYEAQIVTNQFKPAGQVNDFSPGRFIAGLTPASNGNPGTFTSDLDVPLKSSSFQYAIPPFAYPNAAGFDGGLSLGLAFLSDIQVFMFMEAAQGDRRTNVMQAPKLTLFNGQTATINVNDQQFFVTNVAVIGFGGQIVFVPQNNPFPFGVQLAIQAVVSADRRFVRLNLTPTLSNIASAVVPLFPVTTFITPVFEGGAQGQPIPFTQFIQQPQVSIVQIQTTVSIPDGGTVILGGLKTLSEGRNEFGPPVLSKLPYINRLFKNVGYGREAQSLLLMVTPRIIINSEEEERQTGVVGGGVSTPVP
jgi:type II secretory pathway component GspD/PulD (secretin)/tetratricopeptide (TPR) repeat protein